MARLICSQVLLDECPLLPTICGIVADNLHEQEIYVRRCLYDAYAYELRFPTNTSWFKLERVDKEPNAKMSFYIAMLGEDNKIIWERPFDHVTSADVHASFGDFGNGFLWASTRCEYRRIKTEGNVVEMDDGENWGEGDDLEQALNQTYDTLHAGVGDDDDEESDGGTQRFGSAADHVIQSIVPYGISQIRVVALKYQGEAIAFRFKTDKGAFDMRKSVAVKYGLGGFKTETFIALQSVNGMLMSESERKRHVCVPDVSDCEEDCKRLMDAIFGGR